MGLTLFPVASAYTLDATAGAVIFNSLNPTSQTVALGVNDQGHLNTRDGNVVTNASATGIALNFGDAVSPDYRDATSPGCLCEGWGLAVTLNGGLGDRVSGFAGVDSGGIGGLTGGTFGATTTSATSLVSLFEEPRISITHEYGVSLAPNTFQGNVTIRNNSAETITDVVYRRAMDWDVPPTEFSEFVTHQGIVYMSLLDPENPLQALRKTVVPTTREFVRTPGEADDPLGEDGHSPVPGLVHRYPDRVLLLPLDFCSTYCRYCTRSRVVGHGEIQPNVERLEAIFHYLEEATQVRDVLISGGDPLALSDEKLDWIIGRLRQIPHIEFIRIGTKMPAVLPQRITPELCTMLRKYHPIWMSVHYLHPEECTVESKQACERLIDAGIPLGSQTVLLKGVNDEVEIMKELVHKLLLMRVRPYYLYQCDPISGSSHFRTPVSKGLEIIQGLRGFTTGYAVPTFVIDAPGGGGKIPLQVDSVIGRDGDDLLLRNFEGKTFRYPDPIAT